MRAPACCFFSLLAAACAGSPAAPASSTLTLSGLVTATNGGQLLPNAIIDVAGQHTTTDTSGHFSMMTPSGRYQLMISGSGILPHVQTVTAGPVTLDAIAESGGFDLGFYRQFVRNGFEHPEALTALFRWTTNPSFDVQTVDETGAAIDPALVAAVRASIASVVPIWSGGRLVATFGAGGIIVKWMGALNNLCGFTNTPTVTLYYRQAGCNIPQTAKHEVGHVMGYWHTDNPADVMFPGNGTTRDPSARERYHAAIAFSRPVGNRDPDTDP